MAPKSRLLLRAWAYAQALFFLTSCSSLFYYPDRVQHFHPEKLGFDKPQELFFRASDNTQLFAWFFKGRGKKAPQGTVVQFHGNAQNLSSHFISLAWLTDQGYNLFTFDYRGYGRSEGEPNQAGTHLDGLAALEKALQLHDQSMKGRKGPFVVVGQSLGGCIAMHAIDDFAKKDRIALIIQESTFSSYKTVARRSMASHWLTWIISPLAGLLVSNEYGSEEALKKNKIPLLVIHDKEDQAVTFANGQDLFDIASGPKEFWTLHHGEHVGTFQTGRKERELLITKLSSLRR